ncbi:MAG: hypothetical protein SNJ72_02850 [Fimbriimonadales bacterium]
MKDKRHLRMLLLIPSLLTLLSWSDGQSTDLMKNPTYKSAYQILQKREEAFTHYKIVWDYRGNIVSDVTEHLETTSPPRADRQPEGSSPGEAQPEKTIVLYTKPQAYEHKAKLLVHRNADQVILRTKRPLSSKQDGRIYMNEFYLLILPSQVEYAPLDISPIYVPPGNHDRLEFSVGQLVDPTDFSFFANYNILNLFDFHEQGAWRILEDNKHHLVLEAILTDRLLAYYHEFRRCKVLLSKSKGFAPEVVQWYAESQKEPGYEVKVTQWTRYNDQWIPSRLVRTYRASRSDERWYFVLESFDLVESVNYINAADYRTRMIYHSQSSRPMSEFIGIHYIEQRPEQAPTQAGAQEQTRSSSVGAYLVGASLFVLALTASIWLVRTLYKR